MEKRHSYRYKSQTSPRTSPRKAGTCTESSSLTDTNNWGGGTWKPPPPQHRVNYVLVSLKSHNLFSSINTWTCKTLESGERETEILMPFSQPEPIRHRERERETWQEKWNLNKRKKKAHLSQKTSVQKKQDKKIMYCQWNRKLNYTFPSDAIIYQETNNWKYEAPKFTRG